MRYLPEDFRKPVGGVQLSPAGLYRGDKMIQIPLNTEDTGKVSDGYHTFAELYDHRCLLFIRLAIHGQWEAYWKDGCPGWPVLFLETPAGQISYHFPEKFLPIVQANIPKDDDHKWDGHTSADVLKRLEMSWK